jgi:hypothetical protein
MFAPIIMKTTTAINNKSLSEIILKNQVMCIFLKDNMMCCC